MKMLVFSTILSLKCNMYIGESFDTVLNKGYGSVKSPIGLNVKPDYYRIIFSLHGFDSACMLKIHKLFK